MKITVWGGSGFLGSHVADILTMQGHRVTVADKIISPWLLDKQEMILGDVLDKDLVHDSLASTHHFREWLQHAKEAILQEYWNHFDV